jgi:hypothetical protein
MKKETKAKAEVVVDEVVAKTPPATAADVAEASKLARAKQTHATAPAMTRASLLATSEAKVLLSKHAQWIEDSTGMKAVDIEKHATEMLHSGQRTQRLGESFDRSIEDYQAKLAVSEPERTALLSALKGLPEQSPVRKAFQPILDESEVVGGVVQAQKTKKKNKKVKMAKPSGT